MRAPIVDRRTVLRGIGATIALPWLEAMAPRGLAIGRAAAAMSAATARPARTAFLFFPNGVNPSAWPTPMDGLTTWHATGALEPLAEFRGRIAMHTGLTHANAAALGDGPGDHARSAACFLTGAHPRKTAGDDLRNGRSIDQEIADAVARSARPTRLRSLELGSEPPMTAGNCDSGYSCAYSANISWKADNLPNGKETDPRKAFDRVFGRTGESPEARAARERVRRSVLDGAVSQARELGARLGAADRGRLDEYLDGVRDLERRLDADAGAHLDPGTTLPDFEGAPKTVAGRIDLLGEVLALAFRTDATRVATLMLANEGSNRPYPEVDVSSGHHDVSHHGGDAAKMEAFARINRFHAERFAAFLRALDRTREDGVSLLDSTVVLYGGAITDGNRHNHDDLPVLVAGGAATGVSGGSVLRSPHGTPLCNLHLSIAERMGARLDRFGDSSGRVALG
ncbi:MAG: DUF1552 domain-containing protein [Phycisphaerales bacterium]|jgi:hypothetical protein